VLDASGLSFCAGAALQLNWIQNPESPRSGRQHKAWGASPRIASGKAIKPAKRAAAHHFNQFLSPTAIARFAGSIEALVS